MSSVHQLTSSPRLAWLALLALTLAAALPQPARAQGADDGCILAGRLDDAQRWAPRMNGVDLLGADGRTVRGSSREALGAVRQVRVSSPALLAGCNGAQPLASADGDAVQAKAQVPAVRAGREPIQVEAVSYPPLKTAGGQLVELRVKVPADRIVLISR